MIHQSLQIKLTGGLGNQLFKFFAGYKFAQATKRRLVLDLTWYEYSGITAGKVNQRSFWLDYFPEISKIEKKVFDYWELHKKHGQFMRRLPKPFREFSGYFMDDVKEGFESPRKNIIFDGSFENIKFLPRPNEILSLLENPSLHDKEYDHYVSLITKENPLIIHIRLTDYLNFSQIYDVLTPDYYLCAIRESKKSIGNRPVWLFSDDPKSALNWLGNSIKIQKVFPNDSLLNPIQIMFLMSYAKGIVIAHSTFSWWAAYLAQIREQINFVAMPSKFFKWQNKNQLKLVVEGWNVIDV